MKGIMYGIGVGPGDPELLTIRAIRRIRQCDVIAIPHREKELCASYRIARAAVPEIEEKPILCLPMPMTKEKSELEKSHDSAARAVMAILNEGKNVGFVTLGDVSVYSTCGYLLDRLSKAGYETGIECGITSFSAAAARLNTILASGAQELHIIPATYQVKEALKLPGVKVLMKAGRRLAEVKEEIKKCGVTAVMVENCGMEGERVYGSLEEMPDEAGYFCLMIVR